MHENLDLFINNWTSGLFHAPKIIFGIFDVSVNNFFSPKRRQVQV